MENDFDLGNGGAGPSGQTPKNNHQKASERMSEDESKLNNQSFVCSNFKNKSYYRTWRHVNNFCGSLR